MCSHMDYTRVLVEEDTGRFRKVPAELRRNLEESYGSFLEEVGRRWNILSRIGFIIIVTRRKTGTSINRRATSPKADRFQLLNSHLEYLERDFN